MFLAGIHGKDFRCGQENCFSYMVTKKMYWGDGNVSY